MDVNLYVEQNDEEVMLQTDHVETDDTLTQPGEAADAKAVGDALALKVNQPLSGGTPTDGVSGQVLITNGDGSTQWGAPVTTDTTLSVAGEAADAKAVGDALDTKLDKPASEGTNGQVLTTDGVGAVAWTDRLDGTALADAVADWMDDNVTPAGSAVIVDTSLTISGAAADAKVTGNKITDAINGLYACSELTGLPTKAGYWGSGGGVSSQSATSKEIIIGWVKVNKGDVFKYDIEYNSSHSQFVAVSRRDEQMHHLGRTTLLNTSSKHTVGTYTVANDGYISLTYRTYNDVKEAHYYIFRNNANFNDKVQTNKVKNIFTELSGGINNDGTINSNADAYHTELLPVDENSVLNISLLAPSFNAYFFAVCTYNKDSVFMARNNIFTGNTQITLFDYPVVIKNLPNYANIGYIALTYLRYSDSDLRLSYTITEPTNNFRNYKPNFFDSPIKSINHRGYNSVAPENTLPAFKMSKQQGFSIVETDLRKTSDGVFVLLHDSSINRTARNADGTELSSTINISSITYEDALTYDFGIWKNSAYAGTKIPTLDEFLKLCKYINLAAYIEIEASAISTYTDIKSVMDMIVSNGMREKITLACADLSILKIVKGIDPAWRLCYVKSSSNTVTPATVASALKTSWNEVFISAQQTIVNATLAADCAAVNIGLEVWDPTQVSQIKNHAPYVTGMISDTLNAEVVLYNEYITI